MKKIFFTAFLLVAICLHSQETVITGIVYEDTNGNNNKDNGESGIAGVVLSDQELTAVTGEDGTFNIHTENGFPWLFLSMPDGYQGDYYAPKAPGMSFPLRKSGQKKAFRFIHASDTHIDSLNLPRMQRFREMADSLAPDFIIITGDLVRDALRVPEKTARAYYEMYLAEIGKFSVPVYSAVGNHELFGIERDKSLVSAENPLYGKAMFRSYLGPDYYSFNYGGVHFIALDGVDYQNLYYFGHVDSLQLEWLGRDLGRIPASTPVVTFNHIPLVSPGFSFQEFENDPFYGPDLLLQGQKFRHRHIVYNYAQVKEKIGTHPYPLALSGHYHMAQSASFTGTETLFAQTSAITRPDSYEYQGMSVQSGFTLYEIINGKVASAKFIPLHFPSP